MRLRTTILIFPLVAASFVARADVAPPNDPCSLANEEDGGASCQTCSASIYADNCAQMFSGTGDVLVCKTIGATVWTEIWCASADGGVALPDAGHPAADAGELIVDAGASEKPDAWFPTDVGSTPNKSNCGSSLPAVLPLPALFWLLRRRRSL